MSSVEATKAPARTLPVGVMAMPFGLTRKTWPLALSWPAMVEGVWPVTRFSIAEAAEGCWMSTRASRPIEKPCHETIALSVDCWIAIRPGEGVVIPTAPCTTLAPVGRSWAAAGSALSAVPARRRLLRTFCSLVMSGPMNWRRSLELEAADDGEAVFVRKVVAAEGAAEFDRQRGCRRRLGRITAERSRPMPSEAQRVLSRSKAVGWARNSWPTAPKT